MTTQLHKSLSIEAYHSKTDYLSKTMLSKFADCPARKKKVFQAGDILPNGMIYLSRIDDFIIMVNAKDEVGLFTWHNANELFILPNRIEWILIYNARNKGNFKIRVKTDMEYWSSELYYISPDVGFCHKMIDGTINSKTTLRELRVLQVSRLTIQEFSNLQTTPRGTPGK